MYAWKTPSGQGIASLFKESIDLRDPGTGEVRVKIKASSLNYRDLVLLSGNHPEAVKENLIPLSDSSGEVVAVGEGVEMVKTGDRVANIVARDWLYGPFLPEYAATAYGGLIDGVLAEEVIFPQHALVKIPDELTYEEAATLPCAGVTAWNGLFEHPVGSLPGETILTLGTGGVSIFALQFAKAAGMRVIITSSSDEKLSRAKELGADETINYVTNPEWGVRAMEATGGRGVDHVIEIGGPGTLEQSMRSLKAGGKISFIGAIKEMQDALISPILILSKNLNINGVAIGTRKMFEDMLRFITLAGISPVIDKIFTFEDAPKALTTLKEGKHFGKIVIRH